MKKFTKGCLITALVLFIVGLIICGVGGLLGGFRELSEMDGIGSIPFRYYRNVESDWIGFYDEKELERLENIEDIENMADWKSAELEGKSVSCKNELLFGEQINFNDLPAWQKRGIGLYHAGYEKTGYNPVSGQEETAERWRIEVNMALETGEAYREWICRMVQQAE